MRIQPWLPASAVLALAAFAAAPEKSHKLTSVTLRAQADSLHEVVAANDERYAAVTANAPRDVGQLPSHAELVRQATHRIQTRGAEFSYALRALTPLDDRNGPQTELELSALRRLVQAPDEPVYADEELGGRSYFTAIYAERATPACVACHNRNPASARHDVKPGEVMGAIVVRLPLEF